MVQKNIREKAKELLANKEVDLIVALGREPSPFEPRRYLSEALKKSIA